MASKNLGQLTVDMVANIGGFTGPLDKAQREADKKAKEFARTQKANERAVNSTLVALDKQVDVLGKTAKEQKLLELATQGATKAQLAQARASFDAMEKFERQQKVMAGLKVGLAAVATAAVGAVAGTAALVKNQIDFADQVSKTSKIVGLSVEDLSALNYQADLSGVSFQELTGGLTRFSRTVDDALNGVGAGAEVFEKLGISVSNADGSLKSNAKLIEEVADKFASMEDGARKTAIAQDLFGKSGAKMILLLNGGAEEMRRSADEAARFGQIIGTKTASSAEVFNDNLTRLSKVATGLGNDVAASLLPSLVELTNIIQDPSFIQSAKDIAGAFGTIAIGAANAVSELGSLGRLIGANIAALTGNLSELDRIDIEIASVDKAMRGGLNTPLKFIGTPDEELRRIRLRLVAEKERLISEFTGAPVQNAEALQVLLDDVTGKIEEATGKLEKRTRVKSVLTEEIAALEKEKARLEKLIADAQAIEFPGLSGDPFAARDFESFTPKFSANDPFVGLSESAKKYIEDLEKQKQLTAENTELAKVNFEIQSGGYGALSEAQQDLLRSKAQEIDQVKEQQKEAEKLNQIRLSAEQYIASVQQQIALLDAETEAEKMLYEVQSGRYAMLDQTQKDALVRQAQMLDDARTQIEAEREYKRLVADVMTEEEKRTAQLRERLAVIDEMDQVSLAEKEQVFGRVIKTSFDTDPSKPEGEGFDAQREALQSWYDEQLTMLEQFRADRADLNEQWDEQEAATRSEYEKRLTEINTQAENERRQQMADGFSALLGVAEKFYEGMEGEEAAYTRAALQLGQVLLDEKKRKSLESIISSTHSAAMGAYEALSSIPYIGPALGAAAAAGIYVVGGAAAATVMGMAHDGIDSVPQTGTWLLEKGERVTTAETSAKLDATLDKVAQGQNGGGDVVVNLIEDRDRAGQVNQRMDPANEQGRIIDVFVANIQSDGRAAQAIQSKWGLSPRGR